MRRLARRGLLTLVPLPVLILGIACQSTAPPPAAPQQPAAGQASPAAGSGAGTKTAAPTAPASVLRDQGTIPTPVVQAVAQTSPTVTRAKVEPKGKIVYTWHIAIAPTYMDPQENQAVITPYGFQYAIHDALVKHMPDKPYAPSLAEWYQIAPDFKSATFKLRDGIKFHNGDPVTAEDVKFTYENYRGAQAKIFKDKTDKIDLLDTQTLRFVFKEPFLDFLVLYGSPASGAGWIVPKKYYEQVGKDGFKKAPIGAGPYKVTKFELGVALELEAFPDYWRKTPAVKTIVMREVPEDSTRLAMLKTGEADVMNSVFGNILEEVRKDTSFQLGANLGSPFYLIFPEMHKPGNPFADRRVRLAVSHALNRQTLSDEETGGLAPPTGSFAPETWPGAAIFPPDSSDPEKAKQLLAEAGYPNGIDVEGGLSPLGGYANLGERVIGQLRSAGIRTKLNTVERAAFLTRMTEGMDVFQGIILNASGTPGDAAGRIRQFALCPPKGGTSQICFPDNIDKPFEQYEKSINPDERKQILDSIQKWIYDERIFVPIYRSTFTVALGPKMANEWKEVINSIPQYVYLGPYEDVRLKE